MKKVRNGLWLLLLGQIMISLVAAAESAKPAALPAESPLSSDAAVNKILSTLKTDLKLSDDQEQRLKPIFEQYLANVQAVREKYSGGSVRDLRKARKELMALREANDKRVAGVLTEEQMKQYRALREEVREKFKDAARQQREASTPEDNPGPAADKTNGDKTH